MCQQSIGRGSFCDAQWPEYKTLTKGAAQVEGLVHSIVMVLLNTFFIKAATRLQDSRLNCYKLGFRGFIYMEENCQWHIDKCWSVH